MRERVTPAPAARRMLRLPLGGPGGCGSRSQAAAQPRDGSPAERGAPAASPADKAAKIRNRAQEIARRDGCSFTVAFRAAENEIQDGKRSTLNVQHSTLK